ncbi:transcription factor MYC1-like [Impatiens glandulifera]|uniref:transcription factor MYC1-like n=1 Tax=Impatiens glandulifera TaxID=253017 RepID=UPI001FB09DDC|nr:transcription factor MYC1-like [Impatiens glandulifera]XP_047323542.1 transcription factor MYC1-like [Impatiens glandulifera]XP_047323543.1 transcription factor MYC1-like [Impatiens glandulifera]
MEMSNGEETRQKIPGDLRRQLAVAVRSVQWSYAIFWQPSTTQQGILEWGEGYYNGDIKTRKTVLSMELKADKIGLQRSEQLRELYESLLEGESEQQTERPCAALNPDDLSDAEWYYLVCMSFVFNPGQGLPGGTLANGQTIWLCNADSADSKVFSRSLLAKSASIQTVVCFPHFGGVIELGVTDLVREDLNLIHHIKASLLELSKPVCSENVISASHSKDGNDCVCIKIDNEIMNSVMALEDFYSLQDINIVGSQESFGGELDGNMEENRYEHDQQTEEDSFLLDNVDDDDGLHDIGNYLQDSMEPEDITCDKSNENNLKDLHRNNATKLSSLDLGNEDDLHYRRTLSVVLGNSNKFLANLLAGSCNNKSGFVSWKRGQVVETHPPKVQQNLLKKILVEVPLMHESCSINSQKEIGKRDQFIRLAYPDKRIENEKLSLLKSMVPSIKEIDRSSVLGDTIEYLKELEARVEELESCIDLTDSEARARRKRHQDMVEQISDNYDNKKTSINKRKANDIDETESSLEMKVSVKEEEVLIEMRCPWREYLMLDIIDAMNNLHLDAYSLQSSNAGGILTMTLQSKVRGAAVASTRMIKQALSNVVGKC